MKLTLSGVEIDVSGVTDVAHANKIAAAVNQRLKDIENKSPRIDSHAFALQCAFAFATEAFENTSSSDQDTQEILLSLNRLSDDLGSMLSEFKGKARPKASPPDLIG